MSRKPKSEPRGPGPGGDAAALSAAVAKVIGICACAHLRSAARAVTQVYDAALQPTGLRATQVTLLVAIADFCQLEW